MRACFVDRWGLMSKGSYEQAYKQSQGSERDLLTEGEAVNRLVT